MACRPRWRRPVSSSGRFVPGRRLAEWGWPGWNVPRHRRPWPLGRPRTCPSIASSTPVGCRAPGSSSAEPRLAEVYDPLDPDRPDRDAYVAMVDEFGARSVLDIGCGTGTFACLLARRGLTVTAVDPAAESLAVARTKPAADRVRWVHGCTTDLPPLQVDPVTMTANVAQVFLTDAEWAATLPAAHAARHQDEVTASLAAAGYVVDEVRQAPDRPAASGLHRATGRRRLNRDLTWAAPRGRRRVGGRRSGEVGGWVDCHSCSGTRCRPFAFGVVARYAADQACS